MATVKILSKPSLSVSKSKKEGYLKSNENSLTRFRQNSWKDMNSPLEDNRTSVEELIHFCSKSYSKLI
jgi:hypothetical protein